METKKIIAISVAVLIVIFFMAMFFIFGIERDIDDGRVRAYIYEEEDEFIVLRHPQYDLRVSIPTDWQYTVVDSGIGDISGNATYRDAVLNLDITKTEEPMTKEALDDFASNYQYAEEIEGGYQYRGMVEAESGAEETQILEESFLVGRIINSDNGALSAVCTSVGPLFSLYIEDCIDMIESIKIGR